MNDTKTHSFSSSDYYSSSIRIISITSCGLDECKMATSGEASPDVYDIPSTWVPLVEEPVYSPWVDTYHVKYPLMLDNTGFINPNLQIQTSSV